MQECGVYIQTTVEVHCDIYVQYGRHICSGQMPVIGNACIPVLVVTLVIAVSSYGVYILTYFSDIHTSANWHIWHICAI